MGAEKRVEKNNQRKAKDKDGGKLKSNEEKDGNIMVVLKLDMHCDGCALKIKRAVRAFAGVEKVVIDGNNSEVTVEGRFDPVKLRERVERVVHRKVVVALPIIAEETDRKEAEEEDGQGDAGSKAKPEKEEEQEEENADKKKSSTLVLNIRLRCDCSGCIQKIRKNISSQEGVEKISIDVDVVEKGIITVKGTMDMKSLLRCLEVKLKRTMDIIPPSPHGDEIGTIATRTKNLKKNVKKNKATKKLFPKSDNPYDNDPQPREEEKRDLYPLSKMGDSEWPSSIYGYQHNSLALSVPQMFSDENPNACVVM